MPASCSVLTAASDSIHDSFLTLIDHLAMSVEVDIQCSDHSLGDLEETVLRESREIQRKVLEKACQKKADGCSPYCPRCGSRLTGVVRQSREIETRFGLIELWRERGYCPRCELYFVPADLVLGLQSGAKASPSVQEAAAMTVSKMPVTDAKPVIERLAGMDIAQSTLDREARRQGQKAQEKRKEMDEKALDTRGRWEVTAEIKKDLPQTPFTLIIQMDAWNIRERDEWGNTEEIRKKGEKISRWHWVWGATVYQLDNRIEKESSKRPIILSRGHVMTRQGKDGFSRQVYAEAVRQGLLLAEKVLVIADGGVWIWEIANDRFPFAKKRLDFYHASQHLWVVAKDLFPDDAKQAESWAVPLLHQLKHGGEMGVLKTLEELQQTLDTPSEVVDREVKYFQNHKGHLDYEAGSKVGEPIGSGAMESTCRQYQCRFKRPGQFWTTIGDEALMALETFWRNGRWELLYSHAKGFDPLKN